ncbi:hypothetical protein B0A49_06197 [Cryomyces minteri]|uniref:Aromatic-L-amino-acid decarboxylase n=1 Tax=Cryomyces minteri TaxID=331657 RepID=A0A4U0WR15_9PEZI|nr:hypothetical protein B0A49_06197 [Cryomyces minteri]
MEHAKDVANGAQTPQSSGQHTSINKPQDPMDSTKFREAAHAAVDEIINYYDTLPSRRVLSSVEPGYLRSLLPSGPPEDPEPWHEIQKDIESKIMPGLTHWQSPNFMAFFPASSTYPGMLGELYSAAFTAPAFNWLCSPAITELETVVLDWLAKLLNLPDCYLSRGEGGGVIQGSASEAVVTVMVAARERYLREKSEGLEGEAREDKIAHLRGKLVALGSEQAHSSTHKAANIAGTRYRSVPVHLEDDFALTGRGLRKTIEDCKAKGQEPFYLTVSLGTTSTCAVDCFEEIAQVAKDYPSIWIHVDAAYAGAALVCGEFQHHTAHFSAFDSFDMNMHKWLLTNFDASCLYVKRRRDLTDALSITPSYLRNTFSDSGLVTDYRDWQIPLGRRFRAMKIWFVLRTYGISGLKAHIRHHIQLGDLFHGLIKSRSDLFAVLTPPAFALTVITIIPRRQRRQRSSIPADRPDPAHEAYTNDFTPDATNQHLIDANALTKEVYELVNSRGEIFLTSGVVGGVYVIRIVSANPMAEEKYVRRAFDILVKTAEEVLAGKEPVPRENGVEENPLVKMPVPRLG